MKNLLTALVIVSLTGLVAQAQEVVGSVNADGFIVVTGSGGVQAAGLDFGSPGGKLVPVPPGDATAPAAPFTFLLANTPNQVTYGNLGTTVAIDGDLVLSVGYDGNPEGDLTAAWGNGPVPVAFPVTGGVVEPPVVEPPVVEPPVVVPPGNETIPEPTAGLLSVFAALGLLGFRRRRS